jgi:hypothetical protein
MPEALRSDPALYCGCIGGATSIEEYETMMEKAGLDEIRVFDFTKEAQKAIMRVVSSAAANLEGGGQPRQVLEFVYKGGLGYALLSGTKKAPADKPASVGEIAKHLKNQNPL